MFIRERGTCEYGREKGRIPFRREGPVLRYRGSSIGILFKVIYTFNSEVEGTFCFWLLYLGLFRRDQGVL